MKFIKIQTALQDEMRKLKNHILDTNPNIDKTSWIVSNYIRGSCLMKSMILTLILKYEFALDSYVIIIKPAIIKDLKLHSLVAIKNSSIIVLDPLARANFGFNYDKIMMFKTLKELDKKIGFIVLLFNDEVSYLRL